MKKTLFIATLLFATISLTNCSKNKDKEPSIDSNVPEIPAIVENMLDKTYGERVTILETNGFRGMHIGSDEIVYLWSDVPGFQQMAESELETKAYYAPLYGTANISIAIELSENTGDEYGNYLSVYAYVKDAKDFCSKQSNSAYKSVLNNQWAAGIDNGLTYADHNGAAFSKQLLDPMFAYENTTDITHAEYISKYLGEGFEFGCNYVELTRDNVEVWDERLNGYYWEQSFYQISISIEEGVTSWGYMRQSYKKYTN